MRGSLLENVMRSALARIAADQEEDGSFATLSSVDPEGFADAASYRTTFAASQVLMCLNAASQDTTLSRARLLKTRSRTAEFLRSQMGEHGSYNYWSTAEPVRETLRYPDDCDDTFAALAALGGFEPEFLDGTVLANVAKILTSVEAREGGPYRTWLIGPGAPEAFRDIDLVVNSAIGHFLGMLDVELPQILAYQEEDIRAGTLASRYYPGPVQVVYCMARGYRGPSRDALAQALLEQRGPDRMWDTPLETALAITSLIRLGHARAVTQQDVESFAASLEEHGWQPQAFCIDPAREGRRRYAGAPALTAAFVLEALALYRSTRQEAEQAVEPDVRGSLHRAAQESAAMLCDSLGKELRQAAQETIFASKDREITLLPYRFREALGARAAHVSPALLDQLARANLWGWLAYTAYDDFLDDEGDPRTLSVANLCLRNLTEEYAAIATELPPMADAFRDAMDTIDQANAWEQEHCRPRLEVGVLAIPDRLPFATYGTLADRSIGHALPAIALMHAAGATQEEVRGATQFFRDYLIARQLHDDAHDWAEDLARGQINSVGSRVLAAWVEENPGISTLRVPEQLPELRELFWKSVASVSVRSILRHAAQARRALKKARLPGHVALAHDLLDPLEQAATRTLQEREQAVVFLASY